MKKKVLVEGGENKENLLAPEVVKDTKTFPLDTVEKGNEGLTIVRKKTAPVPPVALPPPTPLSPSAEEFHLPLYVTSLPSNNTTLPSLFSSLSLTPPFPPIPLATWQSITAVVEQPYF